MLSSLNITFDQSGTDQDKRSLHQSIRAHRCFGVILGFLGCYAWSHVVLSKDTTDRRGTNWQTHIRVNVYRTKSAKEFDSSRICSSLMSRICRFVIFFRRPGPGLVTTVPYLSNLRIVWRIQRQEIFSCREIYVMHVHNTSLRIRSTKVINTWMFLRNRIGIFCEDEEEDL